MLNKNKISGDDKINRAMGRNIETANERKRLKYEELTTASEKAKQKTWFMPIEEGFRGFVGKSLWSACKYLGINRENKATMGTDCEDIAEKTSNWIQLNKN